MAVRIKMDDFATAREKNITEHKKQLGRNEYPAGSNQTKMNKAYGMPRAPYCQITLCVVDCDWGLSDYYASQNKTASSSASQRWHARAGRSVPLKGRLQRGDHIHVYKNGKSVHVEQVLSHKDGKLICIGSNTSNAGGGSTADGGGTYINDRTAWWNNRGSNRGFAIKGVSRPLYGLTTEAVKAVQKAAGIKVDGRYGPATRDATIKLQKKLGLKADGFPGPATIEALGNVVDNAGDDLKKIGESVKQGTKTKPALEVHPDKKLVENGTFDHELVKAIQWRRKIKMDGKAGNDTWTDLQEFFGSPADGTVSNQSHRASTLGNGITQGWDYTGPGSKGSTLIKHWQAYIGFKGKAIDGVMGPATIKRTEWFLNTYAAAFTDADKPIARKRSKAAGLIK